MDASTSTSGPTPMPGRPAPDGAARDAAGFAKERAGAMLDDAKDTARSKLNEQKDAAAAGIGDVAAALRDTARRKEGEDDTFARFSDLAAERLDRLSGSLRTKDVDVMLRDINGFAHAQPVAFFGLALAAGFVAVRFMKAGRH